jgi:predicted phosphodiesterase
MHLAILADIHGNVLALEAVLADLEHRKVDNVVNLGDCVSGPLWPRETAHRLMRLDWPTIRGNHEALEAAQLAWLRALPPTFNFGDGIFACHGRPRDDNAYLLENVEAGRLVPARYTQVAERVRAVGSRFILCAHSHIPGAAAAGDTMVINPGSVGLPAYEDPTPPAHVSESGSPLARYAMLHLDGEKASFEHIAIPYDHLSAARRAEESQNPAWAHFLATGYARDRGVR